jgi:hypothetical protein
MVGPQIALLSRLLFPFGPHVITHKSRAFILSIKIEMYLLIFKMLNSSSCEVEIRDLYRLFL